MALTTILIYVILALVTTAVYFLRKRMGYWKELGIAHDDPSLLVGNFQGLGKTRSWVDIIGGTYKKFRGTGPFCGFFFFTKPAVVVLDKELIKNVLIRDFSNFTDRGLFHNAEDDPLTGHLFLLDGQKWRALRNKLSPTFTSGKMKFMYPTVVQVADQFVEVFGEIVSKGATIEIKELLARFTTDVIGTCAFGIDCNSLKDPNAEFLVMGRRSLTEQRYGNFVSGLMQGFPELARKLHLRIVPDDVNNFFLRIVRETVHYRETNNIKRNDFLNILIDLKNGKDEDTNGLTIEEIAAQAFVFFLGGFETSSTTMGFALYELAQNHEIQQRLRDEVIDIMTKHNNELSYESMQNMVYMDQVISETLRKYTIVPLLNRVALNDYVVPGHPNYVIKKGMPVMIPAIGIHHDPEIYPEPEKFNPDRFDPDMITQRDSVEWIPFGDGPRNCIGLRFGKMQTRVGLAYLLKHFKFSTCAETEIPINYDKSSFTLVSKNGIFLKAEKL